MSVAGVSAANVTIDEVDFRSPFVVADGAEGRRMRTSSTASGEGVRSARMTEGDVPGGSEDRWSVGLAATLLLSRASSSNVMPSPRFSVPVLSSSYANTRSRSCRPWKSSYWRLRAWLEGDGPKLPGPLLETPWVDPRLPGPLFSPLLVKCRLPGAAL